jgi:cytochrome c-type biogenesis protein CcmH
LSALVITLFALIAAAACAFVVWPLWRQVQPRGRWLLAGAVVVLLSGIGFGTYLMVGRPALAVRSLEGANTRDLNGLIAILARRVHQAPGDLRGWVFLGKAYLTVGDGDDAAKAFARAIALTEAAKQPQAELYSAYGEAVARTAGTVTPDAAAAFEKALVLAPKDRAALYYLGMASAARGDNARAIALWQSLADDMPPGAPLRQELVDRIAALTAASGAAPPDINAMVAGLAARLKQSPDDPAGWQRLVRAYHVVGDDVKARAALAEARQALAMDADALAALSAEAKELKLEQPSP